MVPCPSRPRGRRRAAVSAIVLAASLTAWVPTTPASAGEDPAVTGRTAAAVGLIVTPAASTLPAGVVDRAEDLLDARVGEVEAAADGAFVLTVDEAVDADDARRAADLLERRTDVESAQPDYLLRRATASPVTPNDRYFADQRALWDTRDSVAGQVLPPGGYATRAPAFWSSRGQGSSSTVVAVLDTGITSHPDLDDQVVAGYDMISASSDVDRARDGDGRDADPSDEGDWVDAATAQSCYGDPTAEAEDSSWHGTHVAGIVAAEAGDRVGVAGNAPGVRVQPMRVLGQCGGTTRDIADAIAWSTGGTVSGLPRNATPASVVNLSLGGSGYACDTYTQAAIDGARSRGAVVVAAAGNDGGDTRLTTPANCRGVVTVAASNDRGVLTSYSNRGAEVELAAFGGDLPDSRDARSLVLSATNTGETVPADAGWYFAGGTSQATPAVAAAAALVKSAAPSMTPASVQTALVRSVVPFSRTTTGGGAGVLDLGRLLVPGSAPVVSGDVAVGSVLTATTGPWIIGGTSYRYAWLRDGVPIDGATGLERRVTAADAGHSLTFREIAVDGTSTSEPNLSAARAVPAATPTPSPTPTPTPTTPAVPPQVAPGSTPSTVRLVVGRARGTYGVNTTSLRLRGSVPGVYTVYDGSRRLRVTGARGTKVDLRLGKRKLKIGRHRLRVVLTPTDPAFASSTSRTSTVLIVKKRRR